MTDPELSPSEAAAALGTSTRTVQRWISSGQLPARRVGGRWRVAFDAIDVFGRVETNETSEARSRRTTRAAGLRPIRSVFVANRGEIVERIGRTCDRLGLRTVVPGRNGVAVVDLLDPDAIVRAAFDAGVDALHPGVGFLSESADLADRVTAAGIAWIGPPAGAIRAMGDKASARRRATELGVPVVPGYDDPDQSDAALVAAAAAVGLPLIVKPAGGGGGKGMRVVHDLNRFGEALVSARREALAAFGDERLILERYLEGPRHVEVQVLFDARGQGVHLGERDCSLQRRHQKVLEETPSPAVDAHLRAELGRAALALARSVGYVSAGTCEFLLDDRSSFFFLEMNTRLQVEHPVTELVTGRDLVADQIAIAAGEPLPVDQAAVDAALRHGGHAVEVRLYAEDPDAGFLPSTGTIEAIRWPQNADGRVRIDAGIEVGTAVGDRFDPMLAKIVAGGRDRAAALARLEAALDETEVLGLTTNLRFLRWLVRQPVVRDGAVRIDTLDQIWPPGDAVMVDDVPAAAWATAAALLAEPAPGRPVSERAWSGGSLVDPWGGGWRVNGPARLRLAADGSTERSVALALAGADTAQPASAPAPFAVAGADGTVHVDVDGRSVAFRLAPAPDVDRAARSAAHHGGGVGDVVAPMPGAVLAVHVAAGATIEAGDPLVTLEAMKMEHVVVAPAAGTVREVAVRAADQVRRGQLLTILE